ncbi:hypothetical protein Fbal_1558 [Ferrimonas balearica DSM 9799]|uniref:Uncharacterized protein n=1 Tax=Ferrimonas balearica (strain DSM 9799 / CCM 4581 / KCTC 23876 / PAT) TaxID=550540 RepID=E1SPW7_FERBD|nr:hypothetical protein [Ferrimonas balearica]ADN75762.1 hypothetical protein Fbal_1558 [Ferrimonas balearica DSM 9799]
MSIAIILNIVVLIASLLWLGFDPGFEPFIVVITAVLTLIGLSINSSKHGDTETVVKSKSEYESTVEPEVNNITEVELIASRFRESLKIMNEGNLYSPFTISKLAQLMRLQKTGDLEKVFNGKEEPSFEFIDHYCNTFGINKGWMIHGQGTIYDNQEKTNFDPLDYYSDIEKSNPNEIYFIMNRSEVGEVFIILAMSDYKYKILKRTWRISKHVGGGGRSQIFGLYKLIKELKENGYGLKCGGRILEPIIFEKLLSGSVFPGSILSKYSDENPWWDDFTDVYGKYPISSNYKEWYGKGFSYAQSVVREKLEDECANEFK